MKSLHLSLPEDRLVQYVINQVNHYFPDGMPLEAASLVTALPETLQWIEDCFSVVRNKYFSRDGVAVFDHLHTDQYAMFLYMLGRVAFKAGNQLEACRKLYALNKALHGIDVYYEVELPRIFLFTHPLGTILGRAQYENYLSVYQGVTVGANLEGQFPRIGEGVVLYGRSAVIGDSHVGENGWISFGSVLREETTPPGQIIFGSSPSLGMKATKRLVREHFFGGTT